MAERPPGRYPPQAQSGSKLWLWLLLAVGGLCVLCGVGGFFGIKSLMNTGMGFISCMTNGDLATKAILAYSMEHDGRLPSAETWQDDVRPYYERLYDKMMKSDEMEGLGWMGFTVSEPGTAMECSLGGGRTAGFAFHSALSGAVVNEITEPHGTVILYEITEPHYNAYGTPDGRDADHPNLRMYGEKRGWFDFLANGEMDMRSWEGSGSMDVDSDVDLDISVEDALSPDSPARTSGGGSN